MKRLAAIAITVLLALATPAADLDAFTSPLYLPLVMTAGDTKTTQVMGTVPGPETGTFRVVSASCTTPYNVALDGWNGYCHVRILNDTDEMMEVSVVVVTTEDPRVEEIKVRGIFPQVVYPRSPGKYYWHYRLGDVDTHGPVVFDVGVTGR